MKTAIVLIVILVAGIVGYAVSQRSDDTSPTPSAETSTSKPAETGGDSLDLSGQQLTSLPDSVLDRSNLKSLNVSNNQLTALPGIITKLTDLEVLNVENNRLESLPAEISQLKNLREIRANNNRMASMPDELGTMTWLKVLDISGNKIPAAQIDQLKSKLPDTEIKT